MNYKIAVLPGDGIGPEVMGEGTQVLGQVAKLHGFGVELVQEHHHYHPHCDDKRSGPRGCRFGCQSGGAGRQCHRAVEFIDPAKHEKVRDT